MLFNTNENSISQQVIINKNNIATNTEAIATLTADVVSLKTTTTKNTDEIEVNKSNISQNSTDIEAVKITADSALSKTEYDDFVTIVTSIADYVSIPDLVSYKRFEIQYAGRSTPTGTYVYVASTVVQMGTETADFIQPFVALVWSSTTWAHIGGFINKEYNQFVPLATIISMGSTTPTDYISYGIKVTIRGYK